MKSGKVKKEEQENNFGGQIIFKYLPYWPLFLMLTAAAIGGSWLYLRYTTPMYESSARILIKDEKKGTEDSKALEDFNLLSTKKIIENETEVIQSRTLLNEVVNNLALYAPVYEAGKIRNSSAYLTSPVLLESRDPGHIQPVAKVDLSYDQAKGSVQVGSAQYPVGQWVKTPYGELKFNRNTKWNGEPVSGRLFFSLESPKNVVSSIQSRLKVTTASKQSSILTLTLQDEVSDRGEDIINGLLTAYNAAMINDKNILAANTLGFVEERLKSVEKELNDIEKRNQQYKSRKGAIDIGEQGRLFLQNVSQNDQKLGDINMQLAVLGQVEQYVHAKNTGGSIVPSTFGVSDPVLSQLVEKLSSSEMEYESLKKTTAENNPTMLALSDKIDKLKPNIIDNIQAQKRSLEASRNNVSSANGAYTSMLQGLPEKERELIDINREQSIKNGIYSFLLQKREETALTHASTVSDSRIIDTAESSPLPVSPKKKVIYLIAVLGALFASIGVVTAKETFNRRILFRHEIEKLTDAPIIGEIAAESSGNAIVIGETKKTFIAEQFRKLRTSLKFIGINSKRKRILVTSAIAGEGKSFVAINLALSLALTGKRVVLVDCDLNNPSLPKKLKIRDNKGVSEYLLEEVETEEIVRPTDLDPNLFFVSTGKLPRNPSELMMNGRIEELLNDLDILFDYIVVDTAPVSPVTDAWILSPFCDATLFVVRHRYTPKVFLQRIDEECRINHLNNIAIVFNGVRPRGFGSKNYGYGYGYGYIYNEQQGHHRLRS
jgi:capsular exopolysaccharide synthesis family protein